VFPTTFRDRSEDFPAQPRRMTINHSNMRTATLVRQLVVPPLVRHIFPTPQRRSPMSDLFDLLHVGGEEKASRSKIIQTPKGEVFLRDFCPPSLVERLRVDDGMHAFARFPEREHELLLNIAKSPDCEVTLAHTHDGVIVGQVTLAPGDDWWQGFENVYEVSIEVSSNWRGAAIARHLLAFALELPALEDMILFAMGLSWHWDIEGMHIPLPRYRKLIAHLFGTQGFVEQSTTAPDISMEPGNIFLVRIGKRVDEHTAQRFLNRVNSVPEVIRT
jgi:GNAT superfamily N-acetyltransferase